MNGCGAKPRIPFEVDGETAQCNNHKVAHGFKVKGGRIEFRVSKDPETCDHQFGPMVYSGGRLVRYCPPCGTKEDDARQTGGEPE